MFNPNPQKTTEPRAQSFTSHFFQAPVQQRLTSPLTSQVLAFIDGMFGDDPTNMRTTLIKTIVTNQCKRADDYQKEEGRLANLIMHIPTDLTYAEKLTYLKNLLTMHHASPVITGHPTRVLSNEAIYIIDRIVTRTMAWAKGASEKLNLEANIRSDIRSLLEQPILPHDNLTPEKEAEFANYIYTNILETYPEFLNRVVNAFFKAHGGDKQNIKQALQSSVMLSFQNVWSWVIADFDGNPNKTAKTMEKMIVNLQFNMVELYRKHLEPLSALSPRLREIYAYLQRYEDNLRSDICFDVFGGNEAKSRFISLLDQERRENPNLSPADKEKVLLLRDLIHMAGFWGGLKEFVRQSSNVIDRVFDNFFQILCKEYPDICDLITTSPVVLDKHSQNITTDENVIAGAAIIKRDNPRHATEKVEFHQLLQNDPKYFATLKAKAEQFTEETKRELERLDWVSRNIDIFTSYIISDTTDISTLKKVVILFGFSAYRRNVLHIGQINRSPVNLLPLCETPHDLTNLEAILRAMLDDHDLRTLIKTHKKLSFVAGPSDLGKVGGIFTLIQLIWAGKEAEDVLAEYKIQDPELAPVVLSILYGLGGDSKRRVSEAKRQLHSTFQGTDAHSLATHGAYISYLENVVGCPSENTLRAEELRILEKEHPDYFARLQKMTKDAIDRYQVFSEKPSTQELLKKLTVPVLGPQMNTSSRSEAKNAKPQDITKSRAIGLVNYYLMTGVLWDTFMGAESLIKIPQEQREQLPFLFEQSTVIQEIVYKIIYSIAISDIPRAWKKISPGKLPSTEQIQEWATAYTEGKLIDVQHHHALAHIDVCSRLILQTIISFFPQAHQAEAQQYFTDHNTDSKPSHQIALDLLISMGRIDQKIRKLADEIHSDLLPRYKRLFACIDTYLENSTQTNADNVILACRGDERLTAGPAAISQLTSRLMTITPVVDKAHEETEIARVTCGL